MEEPKTGEEGRHPPWCRKSLFRLRILLCPKQACSLREAWPPIGLRHLSPTGGKQKASRTRIFLAPTGGHGITVPAKQQRIHRSRVAARGRVGMSGEPRIDKRIFVIVFGIRRTWLRCRGNGSGGPRRLGSIRGGQMAHHTTMARAELTSAPQRYAAYTREYLGWGVFALMAR
jgi:hypothetical protein